LRKSYPQITLFLFLTLSLFTASLAQTTQPAKRKTLKNFGSSLKRLKWNPEKKTALESLPRNTAANSDEDDVIRIDTSLVTCELLVLDQHGKNVAGLTANDFSIAEDNTSQTVGHFLLGDNINVPRTIVLIIDYSGSQLPYLENSVAAAKVLVDKLGPKDLMAIVTDDVELIQDFTTDKKKLKKKLDSLQEQSAPPREFPLIQPKLGRSKQYSALMATLNEAFEQTDVRPIIIFQTDGDEAPFLRNAVVSFVAQSSEDAAKQDEILRKILKSMHTEFSLDDLYRTVERSRATVYTVIPGIKLLGLTPEEQLKKYLADGDSMFGYSTNLPKAQRQVALQAKMQSALSGVAPLTGGWTEFLEKPEQAEGIYARIFSDINQRYIVGYYPTNKERDGKRRKIDFAVKGHPEYYIYGRRSYFAPSN